MEIAKAVLVYFLCEVGRQPDSACVKPELLNTTDWTITLQSA